MLLGQVWSKASFNGTDAAGHRGGRGSVVAVTAETPGADGRYGTDDDVLAPLNSRPMWLSIDWVPNSGCGDLEDRVRGFFSMHTGGANFVMGDGSVQFVSENIDGAIYRELSTIDGGLPAQLEP